MDQAKLGKGRAADTRSARQLMPESRWVLMAGVTGKKESRGGEAEVDKERWPNEDGSLRGEKRREVNQQAAR